MMKKVLVTLALGATVAIGVVATPTTADARWHHHGFWRQGPSLAPRPQPQGPITATLTTLSISGRRDVTSGANASGMDGVGTFAESRIATEQARGLRRPTDARRPADRLS